LIDAEDDSSWDVDGREGSMRAPVVSGVDASPVFEPPEHVLDLVALAVKDTVVADGYFAVGL
jgi:hypothetical protein